MLKDSFNTKEAAKLAGFKTPAMVNYLCREGIISPSKSKRLGRGKKRYFSFKDVFLLKALSGILSRGISVSKFKKALTKSKEIKNLKTDMATLEGNLGTVKYMFTDGQEVFFRKNKEKIYALTLENQMEFAFILDVEVIHLDLVQKIKETFPLTA